MGGGQRPSQTAGQGRLQPSKLRASLPGGPDLTESPSFIVGVLPGIGIGEPGSPGEGGTRQTWAPRASAQVPGNRPPSASSRVRGVTERGCPSPVCCGLSTPSGYPDHITRWGGVRGSRTRDVTLIKRSFVPTGTGFTVTGKARTSPNTHFFSSPKRRGPAN